MHTAHDKGLYSFTL